MTFAGRRPRLFHVTDRSALPSIQRHGLLSAEALCELFGVAACRRVALLEGNRDGYEEVADASHGRVTLRRQFLRDGPLATRLAPGLTPADWRRFINAHVFLWPTLAQAERLLAFEAGRDQVVLAWPTAALLAGGVQLLGCRYNNGMVDRSAPGRRRLRGPGDYRGLDGVTAAELREVAVRDRIPAGLPYEVL